MKRTCKISLGMGALLLMTLLPFSQADTYGIGEHMYYASQTFGVWQDYDSLFYQDLLSPWAPGVETRKFYYIGTILPDMLWKDSQEAIQSLVTSLYEHQDSTIEFITNW